VEAMKSLKHGKLRILGYGELEADLQKFVKKQGMNQKIEFLGKVPLDRLLLETQKARAGLVLFEPTSLNYSYASPNKFFEYIMAGTPLVASNIPTFRLLNEEFKVAVLVDPFSPDEISKAMEYLLTDKNGWEELHRNCMKAREKWCWEVQEFKLLDMYCSLLSGQNI
jgi:glycosyltransferase involved in cell wall biosynthesis